VLKEVREVSIEVEVEAKQENQDTVIVIDI